MCDKIRFIVNMVINNKYSFLTKDNIFNYNLFIINLFVLVPAIKKDSLIYFKEILDKF